MLVALHGLLALRLQRESRSDAAGILSSIETGDLGLEFTIRVTAAATHVEGAVFNERLGAAAQLLSLDIERPSIEPAPLQATSADEHLEALIEGLSGSSLSGFVRAESRRWLVDGAAAFVRKGGSLNGHLGLSPRGVSALPARIDKRVRDAALLRALDAVALDGADVSTWERCKRLAPLIVSFAAVDWPRVARANRPPVDWPAWKAALFDAAQASPGSTPRDPKLPRTPTRLNQLAKSNTPFSFHSASATVLAKYRKPTGRQ